MNPYVTSGFFGLAGAACIYLGYRLIVFGSTGVFTYTAGLTGWRLALASTFPGLLFLAVGAVILFMILRRVFESFQNVRHEGKRVPADSSARVKSSLLTTTSTTSQRGQSLLLNRILRSKKLGTIGLSALAIALLALLMGGTLMLSRKQNTPSPDDEISAAVSVVNSRLSDVSLEPSHLVLRGTVPPRAQYMLTLGKQGKDAVYLFKVYEYIRETGGDESKIPTAKLCELVDAVYDRPEPIFESLRQIEVEGKIAFPVWKGINAELQTNLTSIVVQVLYAVRKFYELQHTHPEVLIKGYADGKTKYWERPFPGGNYHFTSIKALYPTDRSSLNPIEYNNSEEEVPLEANFYTNQHLPDLRAQFVAQDLVIPYINQCKGEKKPQLHILKGYEFKDPGQPLERKVQIHILLRDP